jgi:hypothetical protein
VEFMSEAQKYHRYARDCLRLAEQATDVARRDKLLDLAREWLDAALTEEEFAGVPQVDSIEAPRLSS